MTTYDEAVGGDQGLPAYAPTPKLLVRSLDLYELGKALVDGNDEVFSADDLIHVFKIPKNTYVKRVGLIVDKVEGATLTLDLGDSATADGYVAALDAEDLNNGYNVSARTFGPDGKFYADDNNLTLKIESVGSQTNHAAVLRVWAECVYIPV